MKVSVIIPVFNVGKYLINNLESMIAQEGTDIEFIYINDGSTDDSLQILDKYKDRDNRIKVISQTNEGLSAARNRGLREAKGEIVIFVDGDDYIEYGAVELLKTLMLQNDLDVLLADEVKVTGEKKERKDIDVKIVCESVGKGMDLLLGNKAVFTGCLYIYRRSFLEKYNLRFMEGILHEDMEFLPRALYYAKRVMKVNYKFYCHVMRSGSITNTANIRRSSDLIYIANILRVFCQKENLIGEVGDYFEKYRRLLYLQGIHVGIVGGFRINEILCSKTERHCVIKELIKGDVKQKVVAGVLLFKFDTLYKILYLLYWRKR